MRRAQLLKDWIKAQFPSKSFTLQPAFADASFRRYFRVIFADSTLIAMDAPPQKESCQSFLHIAGLFATAGVHVPAILAKDTEQGFLLLTDLGSTTYLQALNSDAKDAQHLYDDAVDTLIKIQQIGRTEVLPNFDTALLLGEMNLFVKWYIGKHLQINLTLNQQAKLDKVFACLVQNNLAQPKVLVHRDYHSRNLMCTTPNPGVLDFQDAAYGPITYDLISLLKDAYIKWDEEYILDWTIRYWEKAGRAGLPVATNFADFYLDFEWMGVQRHLKILGVFARLFYRDGKDSYIKDIPLVINYLRITCKRYRAFHPLLILLDELEGDSSRPKVGYTF